MKLIIDIDDKDKETALLYLKDSAGCLRDFCQESKHYSDSDKKDLESLECIIKALENGIHYESKGDLISRIELKEVVSKIVVEERKEDEKWAAGLRYALKLIDNAPIVKAYTEEELKKKYDEGLNEGYATCYDRYVRKNDEPFC